MGYLLTFLVLSHFFFSSEFLIGWCNILHTDYLEILTWLSNFFSIYFSLPKIKREGQRSNFFPRTAYRSNLRSILKFSTNRTKVLWSNSSGITFTITSSNLTLALGRWSAYAIDVAHQRQLSELTELMALNCKYEREMPHIMNWWP